VANTLACYNTAKIIAIESFIVQTPGCKFGDSDSAGAGTQRQWEIKIKHHKCRFRCDHRRPNRKFASYHRRAWIWRWESYPFPDS